jgi:hypothetical protein
MYLTSLLFAGIAAVVATTQSTNSSSSLITSAGEFDLSSNGMNDAGIGFTFSDSDSMSNAKSYVTKHLPACKIGPLDSIYFYLYGCTIPNSFVTEMKEAVGDGFLYTTDKSLTIVTDVTSSSFLLANAWDLQLNYATNDCSTDFEALNSIDGCYAVSKCGAKVNQITVNCGSIACTGCNIKNFFTDYHFESAKFDTSM